MKYLLFTLLFVQMSTQLFSQMQKGRVTDSKTGQVLIGASIKSLEDNQGTTTNDKGEFEINVTSEFQVSYLGYESQFVKSSGNYLRIQLTQNTLQLGEVVVSAYQKKTELLNVAAAVSVISKTDLQRADNTTIIPIFNAVPGVKLDHYTVGDYRLNIRGGAVAQPSVHSSGYRMYWNNIPITSASGGNPLGGLDINFIDNLEIIKGPGSSIYGAGFGGTVLVNTERATKIGTSLNSDFMVGDYGTLRSTSGIKHNNKWGNIALQYTTTKTAGYRDMTNSEGDVVNLYGQLYTGLKGTLNYLYNYENRMINIAGDLDEETFLNAPLTANTVEPTGFGPDKHTIGIGYDYEFDNHWSASIGGYYFNNDGEFILSFPFFGIFDEEPSNGLNSRTSTTYKNKIGNTKLKLDSGFEIGYSNNEAISYDSDFRKGSANIFNKNEAQTNQFLTFTQAELEFSNQLFLTAGLSYNQFTYDIQSGTLDPNPLTFEKKVSQIVPRFSLLKRIDTYSIYASAGQGFNPPATGIFNDFLNPDGTVNNDLQSSTGWNFEIGSRGNSKNGLFFYDVALYNLNIQNAIISRLFEISPEVNSERKTNAGKVKQTGLETLIGLNATTDKDNFWYKTQLRVGYTFNDFEYADYETFRSETDVNFNTTLFPVDYSGQQIPGTIPHSFMVMADIRTKVGFDINYSLNTYSETYVNDANDIILAGYQVMNVRFSYKANLLKEKLSLNPYVGANNLGNELYSGLTAYNSPFGGFYNPAFGRQWFGGLSIEYQLN